MNDDLFLDDDELQKLTGRCFKSLQIKQLKRMLIPFHVNALGHPVVTRAALPGYQNTTQAKPEKKWSPRIVAG